MSTSSVNLSPSLTTSGSGIDVTAIVDQILAADRAPERIWQARQASLLTQAAALTTISSDLADLKTKINALKDVLGAITAKVATSSQSGIVTATAQPTAASGVHTVIVQNLATSSSYYTDPVASSSATFATGTFSLTVGSTTTPLTVDGTNNTLDGLVNYLNGKKLGITASVINDVGGSRLALTSNSTGLRSDLTVTGNTTGLNFTKSAAGTNASFSIDGVPLSSTTNTVTGALPGIALTLVSAAPTTPVRLTIGSDTNKATQAVNDFVTSYNTLMGLINSQFAFNPATNTAGPLGADSSLRSLQSSLLSDVTYSITGNNGFVNLASMGVNMANDGSLSVDSTQLKDTLTNHFSDFQNFFQSLDPLLSGFAYQFAADMSHLTDPTSGIIQLDLNQNSNTQKNLTDEITNFEDRLAQTRQQLITQYSQVDAALRQFPLIMQQITSQLGTSTASPTRVL